MPRLIPPNLGNGWRPSDPHHEPGTVPVLDIDDDTHDLVGLEHDAALDPDDDTELLLGAIVFLDCPKFIDGSRPGPMQCGIGGSTLFEAATEIVAGHAQLASEMPAWVASTNDDLARVIAEHYTLDGYSECSVIPMDEVPT
jgi:hypothetical protein